MRFHILRVLALLLVCLAAIPCRAQDKVTILYDAFGDSKALTKDWGFSALVEHNGKRILFDTGNNAAIFGTQCEGAGRRPDETGFCRDFPPPCRPHDGFEICAES